MLALFPIIALLAAMSAAPAAKSADEIINRYVMARGGLEKLHAIETIIYRGEYREGDFSMPNAALSLKRPYYKLVGDAEHPSHDFAEGYDGSAWEYYGDPGIVLRTVGAASAAGRHATSIDGPLIDYRERGWKVTLIGMSQIAGRSAYQLRVRMLDGFEQDEFIDAESCLLIAERKAAPIHAFGNSVVSEERVGDYRPVAGVLFPFRSDEVEIATGRLLNQMTWTSITINHDLDVALFSPPDFKRTPVQKLMEQLFAERDDAKAVMWTYSDFRRANPQTDTREATEVVGYQILKMGGVAAALELLKANAARYPSSASSAFGLGRAFQAAGETENARAEYKRALVLDPSYRRAENALRTLH